MRCGKRPTAEQRFRLIMADIEHSGAGRSKATLAENAVHWSGASAPGFLQRPLHRLWLLDQARSLFEFFLPASINPDGGFFGLDLDGTPLPAARSNGELRLLFTTSRMVHCAAIGHQLGMPGCQIGGTSTLVLPIVSPRQPSLGLGSASLGLGSPSVGLGSPSAHVPELAAARRPPSVLYLKISFVSYFLSISCMIVHDGVHVVVS